MAPQAHPLPRGARAAEGRGACPGACPSPERPPPPPLAPPWPAPPLRTRAPPPAARPRPSPLARRAAPTPEPEGRSTGDRRLPRTAPAQNGARTPVCLAPNTQTSFFVRALLSRHTRANGPAVPHHITSTRHHAVHRWARQTQIKSTGAQRAKQGVVIKVPALKATICMVAQSKKRKAA